MHVNVKGNAGKQTLENNFHRIQQIYRPNKSKVLMFWLVGFHGISTPEAYLMPNLVYICQIVCR